MEEISRKRKIRGGYRGYVSQIIAKIGDENDETTLEGLVTQLEEKRATLRKLDDEILELISENDDEDGSRCMAEIDDAGQFLQKIDTSLMKLKNNLKVSRQPQAPPSHVNLQRQDSVLSNDSLDSSVSSTKFNKVRAKLPKLELKKFSGRPIDWPEFWDGFRSAVHENEELSEVDKFAYLRHYMEESAKKVISGFSLTERNYCIALDLLKERFAQPTLIKRAHINELLNASPVFNEKNIGRLRDLCDGLETHYRALQAIGVDEDSYSTIVVPVIMDKIPDAVKLNMIRNISGHREWVMGDLLRALRTELDIREQHTSFFKQVGNPSAAKERFDVKPRIPGRTTTASALFAKQDGGEQKSKQGTCVFCNGSHEEKGCSEVKTIEDRKKILYKQGRCLLCLKRGHKAYDCRTKVLCNVCRRRHHVSICDNYVSSHEAISIQPNAPDSFSSTANTTSCLGSIEYGGRAVLQTALALVREADRKVKARVLFDSGSHKTFVTRQVKERLGLQPIRQEKLGIKTFGSLNVDERLREVVRLRLESTEGKKAGVIEAYVVENISEVQNEHVEVIKQDFKHLKKIWFSDVCRSQEVLAVDILVGIDFLHSLQDGKTIRGEPGQPVAIKTKLGWVISGPLKGKKLNSVETSNVNLIIQPQKSITFNCAEPLDKDVHKMWDLETIGINKVDEIYEDFLDNVEFTGKRYSVKLPWKMGHKPIPTNYSVSLSRLKSQLRRLKATPETLEGYDNIIKEQLDNGIIEEVSELETSTKTSYLPHQAVIRQDAETTKLRVVYDASAKEGRSAKEHMKAAGLNLRKWKTSDPVLAKEFEEEKIITASQDVSPTEETYAKETLGSEEGHDSTKVLGISWNIGSDDFTFDFRKFINIDEDVKVTKRTILSIIAKLFDPLGLVSPVIVGLKILFQELCTLKLGWDDEVPKDQKEIEEEKKRETNALAVAQDSERHFGNIIDAKRFSTLAKLYKVSAYVLRFLRNIRLSKEERQTDGLTATEICEAETHWTRDTQEQMKKSGNFKLLAVQLGVVEKGNMLICKGRLSNSDLDIEAKFPILLPRDNTFTDLVIQDCHHRVGHLGLKATLAELRSRFWVPRGRQYVKRILSKCIVCIHKQGRPYNRPIEGPLPDFRVKDVPPFTNVGVDFAGPLFYKDIDGQMKKCYIVLYTCCTSRALHLDLVIDLSGPAFLRSLRRFTARRGTPSLINSDNAKTFKFAAKFLSTLAKDPSVFSFLQDKRITWRFNLERSPWWGGYFERLVGSVKSCLRKVLGNARLSLDELNTTLLEVEGILNSRPLTYIYDEIGYEPLTPNHLLHGRRLPLLANNLEFDANEVDENAAICKKRFWYLIKKLNHFASRWKNEYLVDLREHHRHRGTGEANIQRGDIVLIKEDNLKRNQWKMGQIENLIHGKDGVIRGAKVRTCSKGKKDYLNRPLQKLFPLELKKEGNENGEESKNTTGERDARNESLIRVRPQRAAAKDASWKTRIMLDS